jgi:methyl-accepting chemotaxis protein
MLTDDFAERARSRVAEARAALARLREAIKEGTKQLAKIDKQHTSDRARVYDRLGQLADDVVEKLPEEATDADVDRAHVIQKQIHDVASSVEEVSLAGNEVEDLAGVLGDAISEIYARLKEAETQISEVERLGTKIGV